MNGCLIRFSLLVFSGLALVPTQGTGMLAEPNDARTLLQGPVAQSPDSTDVLRDARTAQARFERQRRRNLPWTRGEGGYACDNRVGRFCQWFAGEADSGDPIPDPPEVSRLREELLVALSSSSATIPGDRWILGQRVFYLSEAGRWGEAAELVEECGLVSSWWCEVLLGFALHGDGQYETAESAFSRGLAAMDSTEAARWRHPEVLLDGRARAVMQEGESGGPRRAALHERFWLLADPLYLMPGNDRLTEHFSRWTFSHISDGADNPRGLGWGSDLEELTVRYGWDRGWERRRPSAGALSQDASTVGHDLPGTRRFVPSGLVLERPWESSRASWLPDDRPRSAYLAPYAPTLDPGVGQIAVFHRGDTIVVVAATKLPKAEPVGLSSASSLPSAPTAILPWSQPALLDEPDQIGLFLVDRDNQTQSVRLPGAPEGALSLAAVAGDYLMSLEAWAPARGRAGRVREGITTDTIVPDLATLSSLVVLRGTDSLPQDLDGVLPLMMTSLELVGVRQIAVGWEVFGLGQRSELVDFELSLTRDGGGLLSTIGRWFGVGGGNEPVRIGWSEPGPAKPGSWFRAVNMDLPDLDPGEYVLRLEVGIQGREPLVGTRTLEISR